MITVEQLLMTAREEGASDVHITVGVPPRMRVNGRIANLDYPSLSETDCSKIIYSIMDDRQIEMFRDNKQIEFALSVPKAGRYRVSAFMQKGLPACAIRLVTDSVSAPGDIGVPKELIDICDIESGLVILGGVAGSGKSTTIASIIDYINENKCVHILTLEDPIEYVHTHKNAIVNQREVGIDVASYDEGLKLAIREDVDVIQVGRMSEPDTVKAVIKAAKAGSFVIAAVDVAGTKDIIQSIIDEFPPSEKEKINTQLKEVLKMVVSQKLIQQDKDGIKASFEILKIN